MTQPVYVSHGCILKLEGKEFPDGLDGGMTEKNQGGLQDFGLSSWENGVAIH